MITIHDYNFIGCKFKNLVELNQVLSNKLPIPKEVLNRYPEDNINLGDFEECSIIYNSNNQYELILKNDSYGNYNDLLFAFILSYYLKEGHIELYFELDANDTFTNESLFYKYNILPNLIEYLEAEMIYKTKDVYILGEETWHI